MSLKTTGESVFENLAPRLLITAAKEAARRALKWCVGTKMNIVVALSCFELDY